MSSTPALMAASMADTLYWLSPQVTVPDGRAARVATTKKERVKRDLKSIVYCGGRLYRLHLLR